MNKESNSFSDAFRKFLKSENLDSKYREKLLIASWESLMGKPIASRTVKIFLKEGTLYVKLSSAPLKQEMIHHRPRIMEILSRDFGDLVRDIRFL